MSFKLAPSTATNRLLPDEAGLKTASSSVVSFRPGRWALTKLLGKIHPDILVAAVDRWEVAPPSHVEVRRAKTLPGQIDRIRRAEFATMSELVTHLSGGYASAQSATTGYRLKNVLLQDGVLYAAGAVRHLRTRSAPFRPAVLAAPEHAFGSLYESWGGNRWFGNWLSDDCLSYRLAEETGHPYTTDLATHHKGDYAHRLGIRPERGTSAWFRELIVFDDSANNEHRRARADDMRRRLVPGPIHRHPGVFLLRGASGQSRILMNERAIGDHLAARQGFQVIDPSTASVEEIILACAGARVIAGVEGSHMVHGLVVMPADACALVIMPPMRGASDLKHLTDRQGQDYALVVGEGDTDRFIADADCIERTLDLL